VTLARDIEETWASSRFVVSKYVKGNVDRGFTVGGVDEVVQLLDDNCMQLQGMAGSRFIGPFLNTVQRWEQTLSLISEVVSVLNALAYSLRTDSAIGGVLQVGKFKPALRATVRQFPAILKKERKKRNQHKSCN